MHEFLSHCKELDAEAGAADSVGERFCARLDEQIACDRAHLRDWDVDLLLAAFERRQRRHHLVAAELAKGADDGAPPP